MGGEGSGSEGGVGGGVGRLWCRELVCEGAVREVGLLIKCPVLPIPDVFIGGAVALGESGR